MGITAEFVVSVARLDQLPKEDIPEIALVGRSNVGKSSMINALVRKNGLARTSNTPGRTQTLNYYKITPSEEIGKPFYFVDMPGYGFAAVNLTSRNQWQNLIEQYLKNRKTLSGIIQLVDLRHPAQPLDHVMAEWLQTYDQKYLVLGTKMDKVSKSKVPELMLQIAEDLNVDSRDTLPFSAQTGFGRDNLWQWVIDTIDESEEDI